MASTINSNNVNVTNNYFTNTAPVAQQPAAQVSAPAVIRAFESGFKAGILAGIGAGLPGITGANGQQTCPVAPPSLADSAHPENSLHVDAEGKKFTTPGGYTVEVNKDDASKVNITGPDGKSTTIWGDPHVDEGDGGKWQFKKDSTFMLPDGTKLDMHCVPGGAAGATVVGSLTVTNGNDRATVTDMDKGKDAAKFSTVTHDGFAHVNDTGGNDVFVMGKESDDWSKGGKEVIGSDNMGETIKTGGDLAAGESPMLNPHGTGTNVAPGGTTTTTPPTGGTPTPPAGGTTTPATPADPYAAAYQSMDPSKAASTILANFDGVEGVGVDDTGAGAGDANIGRRELERVADPKSGFAPDVRAAAKWMLDHPIAARSIDQGASHADGNANEVHLSKDDLKAFVANAPPSTSTPAAGATGTPAANGNPGITPQGPVVGGQQIPAANQVLQLIQSLMQLLGGVQPGSASQQPQFPGGQNPYAQDPASQQGGLPDSMKLVSDMLAVISDISNLLQASRRPNVYGC